MIRIICCTEHETNGERCDTSVYTFALVRDKKESPSSLAAGHKHVSETARKHGHDIPGDFHKNSTAFLTAGLGTL